MISRWATFALAAAISQAATLTIEPASVNSPEQQPLAQGSIGAGVLRAQILLSRGHFSCGEIDGNFGSNFRKALSAFQGDRKLPVTGTLDPATWAALNTDTAPALIDYTLTAEDLKDPLVRIPTDLKEQAKLPHLGYETAVEAIGEKFHSNPKVLQALNPGASFDRPDLHLLVPNVLTMPPGQAARIVVSKSESSVTAFDASGRLLAFYAATIGSEHDPLPVGEWKINGVARNPKFHYNPKLFWDAKANADKETLPPGPNNPVGHAWIDISKDHYGIHGTPAPSKVGHAASHGCIRLTNWDVLELAAIVRPGTPATLKD